MKKIFTLLLTIITFVTAQAADYQMVLNYARAYVMNAETHQFQLEFVDTETYNAQGSILFCGADNNHINGTYTIDGSNCAALLAVSEEITFEAVSGTFSIAYDHQANYMSYYAISGTLTDKDGKTLELTGQFGSYSAYDYDSYMQVMEGTIDYADLVTYDLTDYLDVTIDYSVSNIGSVTGYSMYNYYANNGNPVANWRMNLLDTEGRMVAQLVIVSEDEYHINGVYDCSKNSFTYYDNSSNSVEANTGMFTISFDHKTDSISYYRMKGELQHTQGKILVDCVLPIGYLTDYQSMSDNYSNPEIEIKTVELKDYENSTAIKENLYSPIVKKELYNIGGQRVSDSYKGIVIRQGKKIRKQ